MISWDEWRATYDTTTFAEQAAHYDEFARDYPEQAHWTLPAARPAAALAGTVTELGGWRGELADILLNENPQISRWTNYDLCSWAIEHSRCADPRYEPVLLDDWPWHTVLEPADLFVATHTLEHIRWPQLVMLADQFPRFRWLHLELPVPQDKTPSWQGFTGTHILEASWLDVHRLLAGKGFVLKTADLSATCRTYEQQP